MNRLTLLLLLSFLAFSACKKESVLMHALIIDGGDIALDGCGWLVETSSETFSPTNLPDEFKSDSLEVGVRYNRLESKAGCGFSPNVYYEIYLTEIHKYNP